VHLVVDTIEYCTEHLPQWNTVSISGYHIREAGANAAQELAFTLADGMCYVEQCRERGLAVDSFAPRLSFFFDVHNDFFEEIAKFRAARRIWARYMRDEVGARDERSWKLRFHSQTAGVTLTEQQPMNNVVRVAYQALAAVLGGTQSLHTNSMDETLALPTESAAKVALRTQQILAHETHVTASADPLGGSWYVESLTDRIEEQARRIFGQIEDLGGMLPAIDRGFFRRAIAESALQEGLDLEAGRKIVVGVNRYRDDDEKPIDMLTIGRDVEDNQKQGLAELRRTRDARAHAAALARVEADARGGVNVMPALIGAAEADATVGEIMRTLQKVYGTYDGGPEW
jgi:methylmalonyl-CoA mutase N-terminal domain/subunit